MEMRNDNSLSISKILKSSLVIFSFASVSILSPTSFDGNHQNYKLLSNNKHYNCDENETEILEPDNFKAISKTDSIRALEEIQNLEENWNGCGAKPIPESVINLSRDIVMELDYQPEVFPTARRTIQMEYELDDNSYLEFEVYPNYIAVMEVPKRDYSKAINKIISSRDYRKLALIVSNFHGGFSPCTSLSVA